jgi:hypothetical protein
MESEMEDYDARATSPSLTSTSNASESELSQSNYDIVDNLNTAALSAILKDVLQPSREMM